MIFIVIKKRRIVFYRPKYPSIRPVDISAETSQILTLLVCIGVAAGILSFVIPF